MRVKLTLAARSDLLEIIKYIAKENPKRARSFGKELRLACQSLAQFPEAFPVVFEKFDGKIRRKVYSNYLIFYHIIAGHVEILHVVQSARDWEALFT